MSIITVQNDKLTVRISTLGAELQSVRDEAGRERLWQGREGVWSEHAPVLFPVCGGLKDDCYMLDGVTYPMAKHGFAKSREWRLTEQTADRAVFLLTEKTGGFPFEYELYAEYALEGSAIRAAVTAVNRDTRRFFYCLGAHEGLALFAPLEEYALVLEKAENVRTSDQLGNLVDPRERLFAEHTSRIPMKREYFETQSMIFRSLESRSITLEGPEGPAARVDFPDTGVVIVWTVPGERYLCIEPWTSAPDLTDSDGRIDRKPGAVELKPGERKTIRHTVSFF